MKALNYVLTIICLAISVISIGVWIKGAESSYLVLSAISFLFGIIFFAFYIIEEKNEEIASLRGVLYRIKNRVS